MTYETKPNWGKWKHFHIVKLWQAVALSMNLDPKHIGRSPQGWLAGEDTILAKSLEFKERLDLAISNILKLTVEHMVPGRPAQWEVTLASFAAQAGRWWKSEVPPEMAALAEPEKPLTQNERNTLLVIIAAICKQLKIDHQTQGAAHKIAGMIQEIGAELSEETILDKLKKIPDALERRVK